MSVAFAIVSFWVALLVTWWICARRWKAQREVSGTWGGFDARRKVRALTAALVRAARGIVVPTWYAVRSLMKRKT